MLEALLASENQFFANLIMIDGSQNRMQSGESQCFTRFNHFLFFIEISLFVDCKPNKEFLLYSEIM